MPEGDTIHRAARTLERALFGRTITSARALDGRLRPAALVGKRVERVEARGKHLLIALDDGRVIHSHMGMTGSWHIYKPGERWQLPEHLARLTLETDAYVAVCFRAPQIDLVERAAGADADPRIARLGPDATVRGFDAAEAARRLRARGDTIIGDALLDQTAIAGVGNIYRSETLFVCRVHPETKTSALSDEELRRVVDVAGDLLSKNVDGAARITTRDGAGPRMWVYLRAGQVCLRCSAQIERRRVGVLARSVYFCARCQPPP